MNEIENIVNTVVIDVALTAAKASLRVELPILNVAPISWLFDWICGKLAKALSKNVADTLNIRLIDIQVDAERRAYEKALDALKNSTPETFNATKQKFEDSLRNLVRFHPQ